MSSSQVETRRWNIMIGGKGNDKSFFFIFLPLSVLSKNEQQLYYYNDDDKEPFITRELSSNH